MAKKRRRGNSCEDKKPLFLAAKNGQRKLVKLLVDNGADVNAQSGPYGNALPAASEGGHEQVVKMLLDAGADVNAQGGFYGNALSAASGIGHEQVAKILLDAGAHSQS
ncbi:Arp, Ankyrin repeat protein [Curvularia clavata]|uniref:Arp, Ankyrin repeat protein n=1 Tax=Curvularia clavata TaxID=95742 RepID=A0A9Q8Z0Z4_CURCL|nr:Arp, Ankyrin repeat protein [Curvularia clavata]